MTTDVRSDDVDESLLAWHDWSMRTHPVTAHGGEELPPSSSPAYRRCGPGHGDELFLVDDVAVLLRECVATRARLVDDVARLLPSILRHAAWRDRLHQLGILPHMAKRMREDYLTLRRLLFQRARDRALRTSAQTFSFISLWLCWLRLEWSIEELEANVQQRQTRVHWTATDFDLVEDAARRAGLQLAVSSGPLASYDWQMLATALDMVRFFLSPWVGWCV